MVRKSPLNVRLIQFAAVFYAAASAVAAPLNLRLMDSATGFGVVAPASFSSPSGASYTVTGDASGRISAELPAGSYAVSIASETYQSFSAAVEVNETNPNLRFTLDPMVQPAEVRPTNVTSLHRRDATVLVGFVSGDDTGQPLANVRVFSSPSGVETRTDVRGFFQLFVPLQSDAEWAASPAKVLFSKSGYQTDERRNLELSPYGDLIMRVNLLPGTGNNITDEQGRRVSPDPRPFEFTANYSTKNDVQTSSAINPTNATIRMPRNIRVLLANGTIDYVSMETYVKRSLNDEWFASWGGLNGTNGLNSVMAGAVAVRSYSAWYVRNPQSSSNDICATTSCQVYDSDTSANTDNAVDKTIGYVVVDSTSTISRSEYSAENNSLGNSCGDGYTTPTGTCLYDPACSGETRNGHGRGMCQWGTARWATGYKMAGPSSGDTSSNGFPKKDWLWIVNHYFPTLTLLKAQPLVVGDNIKATASVAVRACGDGGIGSGTGCALVTTKISGSTGTIIGGPVQVTSDGGGYTWWQIQWSDATVGWSVENYLERVVPSVGAPSGLAATAISSNEVSLSWNDTNDYEAGFRIERAYSSSGPWLQIQEVGTNVLSISDTTVFGGNTYYYRVRAYNVTGNSSYSASANTVTPDAAPTLAAISDKTVNEGSLLTFTASASGPEIVQPFADFEGFDIETATGTILFRNPRNSASTSMNIASAPDYSSVSDLFPAGTGLGSRALLVTCNFTNSVTPWLRLTTAGATYTANPVINLTKKLRFSIYSDKAIKVALGLREATIAAGTAIGSDGGTVGAIEWVGVTNKIGATPMPNRSITAGSWTTLTFDLPAEPCTNFSGGNNVLSTASGLGALEHLAIVPNAGTGTYTIYLDNLAVVRPKTFTYTLEPGAPAGAIINSSSGVFTWTPIIGQGPGTYTVAVRATDNGSPAQSDTKTFTITVQAAPRITTQPTSQTVQQNSNAMFSVVAGGSTPLSYQWRLNGVDISGATSTSYTRTNAQAADAGSYSVVITNSVGTIASSNAVLTVNVPPTITTPPQSRTVAQSSNVTFSVVASGTTPFSYQWRFNGGNISGATLSTYTRTNAQTSDAGSYSVVVTNVAGTAISPDAVLTVDIPPAISPQPQNQTVTAGTTAIFNVSATGTAPLSYQWRKDTTPLSDGTNISGAQTASLTVSNTSTNDAGSYSVMVTNVAGTATSSTATLTVNVPPTITAQPQDQTIIQGTNVTFAVFASGSAPFSYQWRFNGSDLTAATSSSLTLTNVQGTNAGSYSVVVSNAAGVMASSNAVLTISTDFFFPTVKILTPTSGQRLAENFTVTNYLTTLRGTASDNVRVAQVLYSLNNAPYQAAVGTTNWSATISVVPGTNIVAVKAIDSAGNECTPVNRTFVYVVLSALTVNIKGDGQVQKPATSMLEVGRGYVLSAFVGPGTNYIFTNWTRVLNSTTNFYSSNAILNFLMESNLVLNANFIENPFVRAAGSYNGLFYNSNAIAHNSAGFFTLKVTSKLSFSGKVQVDGDAVSMSGKFSLPGTLITNISRAKLAKTNLTLSLALDFATRSERITGTISEGTNWTADLIGDRYVWTTNLMALRFTNRYVTLVPGFSDPAQAPTGSGYALTTVDALGRVKMSGALADNHRIQQSVAVSTNGEWPLYVPLYLQPRIYTRSGVLVTNKEYQGSLLGWLTFATNTPAGKTNLAPQGRLSWIKDGWTNTVYPTGFAGSFVVQSSRHTPPDLGSRVLNITNGTVTVLNGNLAAAFAGDFVLGTNNVVTMVPPVINNTRVSVTAKTGLMSGSFTHPNNTNAVTKFFGAVLQDYNFGAGYFLGTNQSGKVLLATP